MSEGIGEGGVFDLGEQGGVVALVLAVGRQGERAGRFTVKATVEGDHSPISGVLLDELDRALDGVAAGGPAEDDATVAGEAAGRDFFEFPDEVEACLRGKVKRVGEPLGLLGDGLGNVGVGVADVEDADPGEEVEIAVAVDVFEGGAPALAESQRHLRRVEDGRALRGLLALAHAA
jgi:hypothetical protein